MPFYPRKEREREREREKHVLTINGTKKYRIRSSRKVQRNRKCEEGESNGNRRRKISNVKPERQLQK